MERKKLQGESIGMVSRGDEAGSRAECRVISMTNGGTRRSVEKPGEDNRTTDRSETI